MNQWLIASMALGLAMTTGGVATADALSKQGIYGSLTVGRGPSAPDVLLIDRKKNP